MIGLLAALLLVAATPDVPAAQAAADQPAAPQQPAAPVQKAKSDKVCWDETPTGTRFSHRVCATREEVEARRRDDQDWKMRLRPNPAGGN